MPAGKLIMTRKLTLKKVNRNSKENTIIFKPNYVYKVGRIGQGGIIFYDQGKYKNNWRYLEFAPGITQIILDWNNAIKYCEELTHCSFSNWFLPDKYELSHLYKFYEKTNIGNFEYREKGVSHCYFWTLSENTNVSAYSQSFESGDQFHHAKCIKLNVRAIRRF